MLVKDNLFKTGLNAYQLKVIALILMIMDHLYAFLGNDIAFSHWFTNLGRMSAPIFLMITALGMGYTKKPGRFVLRLYIAATLMTITNALMNAALPSSSGAIITNAIFSTMFIIVFIIYMGQLVSKNWKEKNYKKTILFAALSTMPFLASGVQLILLTQLATNEIYFTIFRVFSTFFPSILLAEGGIFFVVLGLGFYIFRNKKWQMGLFYFIYSMVVLIGSSGGDYSLSNLLGYSNQWLMVFALPLMMGYNRQKGKSSKYFFYYFYPLHVYVLYVIGEFVLV